MMAPVPSWTAYGGVPTNAPVRLRSWKRVNDPSPLLTLTIRRSSLFSSSGRKAWMTRR